MERIQRSAGFSITWRVLELLVGYYSSSGLSFTELSTAKLIPPLTHPLISSAHLAVPICRSSIRGCWSSTFEHRYISIVWTNLVPTLIDVRTQIESLIESIANQFEMAHGNHQCRSGALHHDLIAFLTVPSDSIYVRVVWISHLELWQVEEGWRKGAK